MKTLLSILFLVYFMSTYSQDLIIPKTGEKYEVKINSEDSLKYYVSILNNNNVQIDFTIKKSEVKSVIYGGAMKNKVSEKKNIIIEKKNSVPYIDTVRQIKQDFVYLYTNRLILSNKVTHTEQFFRKNYFMVDSTRYNMSDIKFYKNASGYFANIKQFMTFDENRFAIRIKAGRINVFEYSSTYYAPMYSAGGTNMGGGISSRTSHYYNRGLSDLKELNYGNLVSDVKDNPESINFLEKYNSASNAKIGFGVAGTVLFLAGAIVISNQVKAVNNGETDEQQNYGITYSLFGAGLACYGIAIGFHFKKGKNLTLAIDAYNR